jgi:hypothetical protein
MLSVSLKNLRRSAGRGSLHQIVCSFETLTDDKGSTRFGDRLFQCSRELVAVPASKEGATKHLRQRRPRKNSRTSPTKGRGLP